MKRDEENEIVSFLTIAFTQKANIMRQKTFLSWWIFLSFRNANKGLNQSRCYICGIYQPGTKAFTRSQRHPTTLRLLQNTAQPRAKRKQTLFLVNDIMIYKRKFI